MAGTTVAAYNATTGDEVDSSVASGTPRTFSLTVPTGASYKIYLIENEGSDQRIFPLYQNGSNVFALSDGSDISINLGYVNTVSGVAVPTNNPLLVAGVTTGDEDATVPADLADSSLSTTNMVGNWYMHGLAVGVKTNGTAPCWFYGTSIIASDGTVSNTKTYSFQQTLTDSQTINSILPSGVLLPALNIGRRMLMLNGQMIIGVDTDEKPEGNAYYLNISQRAGTGPYSTTDLQGTWRLHGLWAFQNGTAAGWSYGSYDVAANGSVQGAEITTSSGPRTQGPFTFSIDGNGIVTIGTTGFHGVMSQDKKIIVATLTTYTLIGSVYYPNCNLLIYQKVDASASFSEQDLQGVWNFHELIAGTNGSTDPKAWQYGHLIINGNEFTTSDVVANGVTAESLNYHVSIASNGVVTLDDAPENFNGLMSDDKRMMISVSRNGGAAGYRMTIYQR